MLAASIDHLMTAGLVHIEQSQECVNYCLACNKACLEAVAYCSERGSTFASPLQLKRLLDCAMVAEPCAYFVARGSEIESELCKICASTCRLGNEECLRFREDSRMKSCAAACLKCAQACEKLANPAMPLAF